jgi:hypothetical protein
MGIDLADPHKWLEKRVVLSETRELPASFTQCSSIRSRNLHVYATSEMRLPVGEKYLRYRIKSPYSEKKRREFH